MLFMGLPMPISMGLLKLLLDIDTQFTPHFRRFYNSNLSSGIRYSRWQVLETICKHAQLKHQKILQEDQGPQMSYEVYEGSLPRFSYSFANERVFQ